MSVRFHCFHRLVIVVFIFIIVAFGRIEVNAAQLRVAWTDNSFNEEGFELQRGPTVTGPFSTIAVVGSNTSSYIDSVLSGGTTYCYRVRAFNLAGQSDPSNIGCATTATTVTTLIVNLVGTGSGHVTSTSGSIDCNPACTAFYSSGTPVTLTATPGADSTFAGWSGDADCSDGSVTMNDSKTCTATFNRQGFVMNVIKIGSGKGTVTSVPGGINCGGDCVESYLVGTLVTITAKAIGSSVFAGWSGGGCSGTGACAVRLNANTSVTATFSRKR